MTRHATLRAATQWAATLWTATLWAAARTITLAVVLLMAAAGCSTGTHNDGEDTTMRPFSQARQQVEAFVDQTIARAAPGRPAVPTELDGHLDGCKDRYGRGGVQGSWSYGRQVRQVDAKLGDTITTQTEAFWRAQGLSVRADDSIPGVSVRYGKAADDFDYELIVNRNHGFADFGGSTPCYPYAELPPATPQPGIPSR
jgi:hypothetical protein